MGRQGRGDRRDRRRLRRHLAGRDRVSRLRPELLADRPNARRVPPRARVPLRPARTQHGSRLAWPRSGPRRRRPVLAGTYLFFPATLAFDQLEFVGAGAWLGVCAALIPLGAGAAYLLSNQARLRADVAREEAVGRLVTLVGLALVLAGVWLPVDTSNDGTYWNVTGAGHSLGILF